ncbi:MAG: hypothetical protein JW891_02510 [Candidatus Lokiarchaeota archaeon]|nr:hypothetical protein [Candidatus Lokiarchaeota archaeon]
MLSLPQVRANPVILPIGPIGNLLQKGSLFLIWVIIPLTYIFTILIEFVVYYAFFRKSNSKKKKKLFKLVAFVNFVTVPITQMVIYFTNLFFMSIWTYIIVEFFVFYIELIVFRDEIGEIMKIELNKNKSALMVFVANLISFLVGILFFSFLFNVFSNLNQFFIDGIFTAFYSIILHSIIAACFVGIGYYYKRYEMAKYGQKTEFTYSCYCCLIFIFILISSFVFPVIIMQKSSLFYTTLNG